MQSLDVIAQFGVWLWFALAVALFVLESIVPGVHFVWFGVSAAVVGVIALLMPIAWPWQLIVFALVALATVFWVRSKSREEFIEVRCSRPQYTWRAIYRAHRDRRGRDHQRAR